MTIFYSPSLNSFFDGELKSSYIAGTGWPDDALEVEDSVFSAFTQQPPEGKMRIAGQDGLPAWGDLPAPTPEDVIAMAEQQKAALRAAADAEISWRQDAVDAGIATADETAALVELKKYRVLLMRVDTAKPVWPVPPEAMAS